MPNNPTFTLLDDAGGRFILENNQIKVATPLDYETQQFHDITIGVTGVAPRVEPQTVTINIEDILEQSHIVLTGTTVSETAELDDIIGTFSAIEVASGIPLFSLVDDAGGRFAIDGNNLIVAGEFDYLTNQSHVITVSAMGVLPPAPPINFTINVLSAGPTATIFSPASGATGIAGNIILEVTFNAIVVLGSGYFFLRKVSDNSIVDYWDMNTNRGNTTGGTFPDFYPGTVIIDGTNSFGSGTKLRLQLTTGLSGATEYYVNWEAGVVRNATTNIACPEVTSTTLWRFTTGGVSSGTMVLSNSAVQSTIFNGTAIGDLSITGGSGTYHYEITTDPDGLFALTGQDLSSRNDLTTGSLSVTVRATNDVDPPIFRTFTLDVRPTVTVPANTVAPVLSRTTAIVSDTVSCSSGTWNNLPTSYTYQWMRGGVDIGGATASTYLLVAADVSTTITCKVQGVNSAGSATAVVSSNSCAVATGSILDAYTLGVVLSLRKVVTAYAGNCVRIKRSSDSTEQDFGFVSGVVDTAGIATFVGGGTGTAVTWYDQSGNGINVTSAVSGAPPLFLASGITGKPALSFPGANALGSAAVDATAFSGSNQITAMIVGKNTNGYLLSWYLSASNIIAASNDTVSIYWNFGSSTVGAGGGQVSAARPVGYGAGGHLLEMYRSSANSQSILVDGDTIVTSAGMDDVLSAGTVGLAIGAATTIGALPMDGELSEVFLLKTDIGEAARALVRSNMASYHDIDLVGEAASVQLRYSGHDANNTLENLVPMIPARFNYLPWNNYSHSTNFENRYGYTHGKFYPTGRGLGREWIHTQLNRQDSVAGPTGSLNATRLIPNSVNAQHSVITDSSTIIPFAKAPIIFRLSFIAKPAGYTRLVATLQLNVQDATPIANISFSVGFDLSGGNCDYATAAGSDFTIDDTTATSLGGGWYLCKIDYHFIGDKHSLQPIGLSVGLKVDNGAGTAANSITFIGNGTSGVDVFWFNLLPKPLWTLNWVEDFYDEFTSTATIDVNDTKVPGFNWYVDGYFPDYSMNDYGFGLSFPSPASYYSMDQDYLKLYADVKNTGGILAAQMFTAVYTGPGTGVNGIHIAYAPIPPFIQDSSISWDGRGSPPYIQQISYDRNHSWWSEPLEMLDGTIEHGDHWIEADSFEIGGGGTAALVGVISEPWQANDLYAHVATASKVPKAPRVDFFRCSHIWLRPEDTGVSWGLHMFFIKGEGYPGGFAYSATDYAIPVTTNLYNESDRTRIGGYYQHGTEMRMDMMHRVFLYWYTGNTIHDNESIPLWVDWAKGYQVV